jgi:hypothetical protein
MDEGITPLEYMLRTMRTEPTADMEPREMLSALTLRFEAAKAAAPYMHPRLAAIEHSGPNGGPIAAAVMDVSAKEFADIAKGIAADV